MCGCRLRRAEASGAGQGSSGAQGGVEPQPGLLIQRRGGLQQGLPKRRGGRSFGGAIGDDDAPNADAQGEALVTPGGRAGRRRARNLAAMGEAERAVADAAQPRTCPTAAADLEVGGRFVFLGESGGGGACRCREHVPTATA
eukprot:scaffold19902_cov104-Isochrysis_galbana.AAC.2